MFYLFRKGHVHLAKSSVDQIKLSQINQISRFILHLFIFEIWLIGGMFYLFRKGHVHLAKSSQIQVSF